MTGPHSAGGTGDEGPRPPGNPILVNRDGPATEVLERVDLADRSIGESRLQRLIYEHPEVLPVAEIDETFGPVLPIGREVATSAGPIDVLLASPSATLTIVETKLWRNPQARREVVGQILDYAAAVATWSYEHLDSIVHEHRGEPLWDLMKNSTVPDAPADEALFIDTMTRNLANGRFMLLIVGDGIRAGLERMVDYVQASPQLQFTLALSELRIFERSGTQERLVIPSVVARTTEVTRAIVEVSVAPETSVKVEVAVPGPNSPEPEPHRARFLRRLDAATSPELRSFVEHLISEYERDPRFRIEGKQSSVMIKRRRLASGAPHLTLLGISSDGSVFIGWLDQQLAKYGFPRDLAARYSNDTAAIAGTAVHPQYPDTWATRPSLAAIREVWPQLQSYIENFAETLSDQAPGLEDESNDDAPTTK